MWTKAGRIIDCSYRSSKHPRKWSNDHSFQKARQCRIRWLIKILSRFFHNHYSQSSSSSVAWHWPSPDFVTHGRIHSFKTHSLDPILYTFYFYVFRSAPLLSYVLTRTSKRISRTLSCEVVATKFCLLSMVQNKKGDDTTSTKVRFLFVPEKV
jgi:hypothetical protein